MPNQAVPSVGGLTFLLALCLRFRTHRHFTNGRIDGTNEMLRQGAIGLNSLRNPSWGGALDNPASIYLPHEDVLAFTTQTTNVLRVEERFCQATIEGHA